MGWGGGRWGTVTGTVGVVAGAAGGGGMAPFGGLPPLGGACQEYQRFSAHRVAPAPPWSRNHSTHRLPMVGPSAGLAMAPPMETHRGVSSTTTTAATVSPGWRPNHVGRAAR